MSRIDEAEAQETLRLLASMDELAGELDTMRNSARA